MKKLWKKIRNAFAIHIVSKRLDKENRHWSDDWEKAEYKIRKFTNDNGFCKYTVFRTLNGETEQVSHWLGHKTYEEALKKVEDNKAFYREQWNIQNTGKEEWVNVC